MSSGSNSASAIPGLMQAENQNQMAVLNMIGSSQPQQVSLNPNDYNQLINTYSQLNNVQSQNAEAATNPNLAAARTGLQKNMADLMQSANSGNIDPATSNALMKTGLAQASQNGTPVTPGSRGATTVANLYGQGANNYLNQIRQMVSSYLSANPQTQAGLGGQDAAQLKLTQTTDNLNSANDWRNQLLSGAGQMTGNSNSMANNMFSAAANQSASNAAGQNALLGNILGGFSTLGAAGVMAA